MQRDLQTCSIPAAKPRGVNHTTTGNTKPPTGLFCLQTLRPASTELLLQTHVLCHLWYVWTTANAAVKSRSPTATKPELMCSMQPTPSWSSTRFMQPDLWSPPAKPELMCSMQPTPSRPSTRFMQQDLWISPAAKPHEHM